MRGANEARISNIAATIRTAMDQWFPERQIFLRADGNVKYFHITQRVQLFGVAVLCGLFVWLGVTSWQTVAGGSSLEDSQAEIATLESRQATLEADLSAMRGEVLEKARMIEDRQNYLEGLMGPDAGIPTVTDTNTQTNADSDAKSDEVPIVFAPYGSSTLAVNARLADLEAKQEQLALNILDRRRRELAALEKALEPTGITGEDLLEQAASTAPAMGGPFIADWGLAGLGIENATGIGTPDHPILLATRESNRLQALANILNSYPAALPTDKYYLSSPYGSRIDPFKKVRAAHYGLDMAGWPGTKIHAAAKGTVTVASVQRPYGKMVEIDHGNTFRTRYGHLRHISVKVGEQIEVGQEIGKMGGTGRATSTHLHYEVWFAGKAVNPLPFIEAAQYVRKIQRRARNG